MISIIVPVYNMSKYLKNSINSILDSKYQDFELIIINDGSTDSSLKICKEFAKMDNRISIINQEKSGVSVARNRGIENSNGEWIIFIDSDDMITNDYLDKIIYYYSIDSDIIIFEFYNDLIKTNGSNHHKIYNNPSNIFISKAFKGESLFNNGNSNLRSSCAKAYKRDFIMKNNIRFIKNLSMGEDMLFNINCYMKANSIIYQGDIVYNYVIRKDSATHKYMNNMLDVDKLFFYSLRKILEEELKFSYFKELYYDLALSGIIRILLYDIFCKENSMSYIEKKRICKKIPHISPYKFAIRYNWKTGSLYRKLVVVSLQMHCFFAVNTLCKLKKTQLILFNK